MENKGEKCNEKKEKKRIKRMGREMKGEEGKINVIR